MRGKGLCPFLINSFVKFLFYAVLYPAPPLSLNGAYPAVGGALLNYFNKMSPFESAKCSDLFLLHCICCIVYDLKL